MTRSTEQAARAWRSAHLEASRCARHRDLQTRITASVLVSESRRDSETYMHAEHTRRDSNVKYPGHISSYRADAREHW